MRRTPAFVALIAATAIFLAGCTGIPTTGQVQRSDVEVEPPAAEIEFVPASPVPGDSQEGILRGFIDAASSPQNDFAVARQFLSSTFAPEWDPNASVTVDNGSREFLITSDVSMSIRTDIDATVTATGNYTDFDSRLPTTLDFGFSLEDGEWRIASAPPGVVLERFTFDQIFAEHALYFFDPAFSQLVPDVRYFASRASTPTRIMKALLAGPSAWLAEGNAVVSAYPPGTQLVADTVPITGTTASVDVTAPALDTTSETKRRMLRQAAASLGSLSSIFTVQLSIEGVPQDISAQADEATDGYPQVSPLPLVFANGRFGYLQPDGSLNEISRISEAVASFAPSAAAYSDRHRAATVNTDDGLYLVRSSGSTALVDSRADLVAGVFDYFGYVWSVPRTQPNALFASTISGVKRIVTTPWPEDSQVVSMSLSREGTRIAAVIKSGSDTSLYVSGIARDGRNGPIDVGSPLVFGLPDGTSLSAVWVDSSTVGVLATQSDNTSLVSLIVVGGSTRTVRPGTQGLSLSAGNSLRELVMRAPDGTLFGYRAGGAWSAIGSGVGVLAQVQ